jgi:hypothetical protein
MRRLTTKSPADAWVRARRPPPGTVIESRSIVTGPHFTFMESKLATGSAIAADTLLPETQSREL